MLAYLSQHIGMFVPTHLTWVSFDMHMSLFTCMRLFWQEKAVRAKAHVTTRLTHLRLFWRAYVSFHVCGSLLAEGKKRCRQQPFHDTCDSGLFWHAYISFHIYGFGRRERCGQKFFVTRHSGFVDYRWTFQKRYILSKRDLWKTPTEIHTPEHTHAAVRHSGFSVYGWKCEMRDIYIYGKRLVHTKRDPREKCVDRHTLKHICCCVPYRLLSVCIYEKKPARKSCRETYSRTHMLLQRLEHTCCCTP